MTAKRYAVVVIAFAAIFADAQSLPDAMRADTARLEFHVSDPHSAGSVDSELRRAISAVHGQRIVKLRVFLKDPDDAGRIENFVRTIVPSPWPALSLIQVAGLENDARLAVQAITEADKPVNPAGIAFISGQLTQTPRENGKLSGSVAPLAAKSVANIRSALSANSLRPEDVVSVTCYSSSLSDAAELRKTVAGAFARAAIALMQIQRDPANNEVECESVARLRTKPQSAVQLVNPTNAQFAQMALVAPGAVFFTSVSATAAPDDAGIREMFQSLAGKLDAAGTSLDRIFYVDGYPVSADVLSRFRDIRWQFLDKARAPASTNLVFEGVLPAGSAAGIDAIALSGE